MTIDHIELERLTGGPTDTAIPPFCVACGYNLTGLLSDRCPECGTVFVAAEWRVEAARINRLAARIRDANEWVHNGSKVVAAGVVLLVVILLVRGSWAEAFARIAAAICGTSATFLGIGVFRVKRLPLWAYERLAPSPAYAYAVGICVSGAIIVVLAGFLL